MDKPTKIIADRITQRARELGGMTDQAISLAYNGKDDAVRDIRRGRMPGAARLKGIADVLQTTPEWLLGDDAAQADGDYALPVTKPVHAVATNMRGFDAARLRKDLPVLGAALGSANGDIGSTIPVEIYMIEMGDVIEMVRRPPGLNSVTNAYALYVSGDSQYPRFEQGELIYVNPNRPASLGDDVVVQLTDESDTVVSALVKRLRRRTASSIVLEQFNPPREITIPTDRVKAVHRVMPLADLLGF